MKEACNATRGEVLSQLPNDIGSCNKNELDFDKPIKDIVSECGASEIPVTSSSSFGGNSSSSSPVNNNGSSSSGADVYELVNYDGNSFTFIANEEYECVDGGILRKNFETKTMDYSIYYSANNNIFALSEKDTINFSGTSNNIIGTWIRTKNKAASCEYKTGRYCIDYDCIDYGDKCECREYKEESWYECKEGWDITKLVFTQNTFAITQDYCYTDKLLNGTERSDGWKYNIINCNTYELSKGTEKVRIKITGTKMNRSQSMEVTYNGKTCEWSEVYSVSQREKACSDAWKKIQTQGGSKYDYELEDYYHDFLRKDKEDFKECTENFPAGP